ncbi:MAG: hypothetical protein Q8O35_13245 [Humidesulfovibrio sp.]|jgi:hypothetical protein|uniref:hypothetical protein n=1 Tax=Humidesulfovibrio sp. TaxID=2910988 RepID=UPI002733205C|nr:hypothetical protein [Humidesulfovibrio sp.]MDP2849137.1 hypothetical protein [Humidesulfovibrio sp.]
MATVVPQSELVRRAVDWITERLGQGETSQELSRLVESAAMRFNLGPLEVEFLERFYNKNTTGEKQS